MKSQQLHTEEAPNKWWAAQDARQRNINNKSHYSASVQKQVELMKLALGEVFRGKVYEAYGKKGVSIKVDGAYCANKTTLAWLEEAWTEQGITKKVTPQGVIYRLTTV